MFTKTIGTPIRNTTDTAFRGNGVSGATLTSGGVVGQLPAWQTESVRPASAVLREPLYTAHPRRR